MPSRATVQGIKFMARLRTKEGEERYKKLIDAGLLNGTCKLCEAPSIKNFTYWKIVHNEFPYDRIAKIHDMVIPKRHITETDLSAEEKQEYSEIKAGHVGKTYEYVIEPMLKMKSIPEHFHLHLIVAKD